jgi:hypothetical protein
MNPEIRDLWADALVSGEYERQRHRLKGPTGAYCPLGVLCDLYRQKTGQGAWGKKPSLKQALPFIIGDRSFYCFPPPEVLAWAGISDREFGRHRDTIKGLISGKNDVDKLDFPGMAEWLRANL